MSTVLSWNVAGRVRESQQAQIAALATQPADIVCLQEVTPTNHGPWRAAFAEWGMDVAVSEWPPQPRGSRRLAVLIASRERLTALPALASLPWPERYLACRTSLGETGVEVHNLHAPLSQKPDRVKVRTFEVVFDVLASADDGIPRILAGDLNTPQYESREGEIQTFARTRTGRIRPAYGERHDRAELALVAELPRRGWSDAFRRIHGYARRDRSWMPFHRGPGYRLDHVIVSAGLEPVACEYVHEWREAGLSDHSPIWAELAMT